MPRILASASSSVIAPGSASGAVSLIDFGTMASTRPSSDVAADDLQHLLDLGVVRADVARVEFAVVLELGKRGHGVVLIGSKDGVAGDAAEGVERALAVLVRGGLAPRRASSRSPIASVVDVLRKIVLRDWRTRCAAPRRARPRTPSAGGRPGCATKRRPRSPRSMRMNSNIEPPPRSVWLTPSMRSARGRRPGLERRSPPRCPASPCQQPASHAGGASAAARGTDRASAATPGDRAPSATRRRWSRTPSRRAARRWTPRSSS